MAGKRTIFEEVGAAPVAQSPKGGLIDAKPRGARGAIRVWLVLLFVMVMAMIAVGGLTRLTDSGLSITEWRPLTGALPPLSDAAWAIEFDGLGVRVCQISGKPRVPVAKQGHEHGGL